MVYGTQWLNAAFTIHMLSRIDTYFFKVHPNIFLPSTPKILFPIGLSVKISKAFLPSYILAT